MIHAAIPTKYNHVQFRSRLEARWAAFFDFAGWEWHYEPVDMSGWIPDFVLVGKHGNKIYVEVKPIFWRAEMGKVDVTPFYSDELRKIKNIALSYPDDLLLLGANILNLTCWTGETTRRILGLLCDTPNAALLCFNSNKELDLTAHENTYRLRISGESHDPRRGKYTSSCIVDRFWAEAGNAVQWRRPRGAAHA